MQQKEINKFLNQISQTSTNLLTKLNYQKSLLIKPSQLRQCCDGESDTNSSSATDSNSNFEKTKTSSKFKKNEKSGKNVNQSNNSNGKHLVQQNNNNNHVYNGNTNGQPQKIISIVNERKLSNSSW